MEKLVEMRVRRVHCLGYSPLREFHGHLFAERARAAHACPLRIRVQNALTTGGRLNMDMRELHAEIQVRGTAQI